MTSTSSDSIGVSGPIPLLDLAPDAELLGDELRAAFDRVMRSGQFILGHEVESFEREFADHLGVPHAIGVNSGTDALTIALRAMDIGPGDEVITSPFTFVASAEAVSMVGATPVFADINPDTFTIEPEAISTVITPRTRAIIPVHLFGQPADMAAIHDIADRHDLRVLEDVAQAQGAKDGQRTTGTWGDAAAFSFFPSKNLGAFGDAGLIATHSTEIADAARMLRAHGSRRKYFNEVVGYNSRLDALQAAILRVKLPHVDAWNASRIRAAQRYGRLLSDIPGLIPPALRDGVRHVFHQYTVRITSDPLDGTDTANAATSETRRDRVSRLLAEAGISTAIYYPVPLHRLPLYADQSACHCPIAELTCREVLSLPMGPHLTDAAIDRVAGCLRESLAAT